MVCHLDVIQNGSLYSLADDTSAEALYFTFKDDWKNQSQLKAIGNIPARSAQKWTLKEYAKEINLALFFGLLNESQVYRTSYKKRKLSGDDND